MSLKRKNSYDAFVSYSRKDKVFVKSLVKALLSFTPPKLEGLPQRRLSIFRDESDLIGSDYYESIDEHLKRSKRLIIICSPHATKSSFVNDEIRRFLAINDAKKLIPIIIGGKPNNEVSSESLGENAFPPALSAAIELPLAINYVGIDLRKERVNKGMREAAWYSVVASIIGVSRDELEQRDRKRQWRRRNIFLSITFAVMACLSALTVFALWQKEVAVEQKNFAEARLLASQANALLNKDESLLARSMLLAIESLNKAPSDEAASTLRAGLGRLGRSEGLISYEGNKTGYSKSENRRFELHYQTATDNPHQNPFPLSDGAWEARVIDSGTEIAKLHSLKNLFGGRATCQNAPSYLTITLGEKNSAKTGFRYVRVKNNLTGEEALLIHEGAITACSFSSSGNFIVTASGDISRELPPVPIPGDYTLRIWSLPPAVFSLSEENLKKELVATAFNPVKDILALSIFRENSVRLLDLNKGSEIRKLEVANRSITDLAFSANGRYLASSPTYGEAFDVWSVDDYKKVANIDQYTSEGGVKLSPNGQYLITEYGELTHPTGSDIWDIETKKSLAAFGADPSLRNEMSFSSDGRLLFTMETLRSETSWWGNKRLTIWDEASKKMIKSVDFVESFAIDADGKTLALRIGGRLPSSNNDGSTVQSENSGDIQIWTVNPPRKMKVFSAEAKGNCLSLSPKGRFMAFCEDDNTVSILNLEDEKRLHNFKYQEAVLAITFSPDGQYLAIATYAYGGQEINAFRLANILNIVNIESGKVATKLNHGGGVDQVAFSRDGKYIATNIYISEESGLGKANVWMWRHEDLIEEACRTLPRNMTLEEWNSYMIVGEASRKTCDNLPVHPSAM